MKQILAAPLLLMPCVAKAHVGHIAEAAGHSHWIAGAAIAAAAAIALAAGWRKGASKPEETAETGEDVGEETGEEAAGA